MASSWFRRLKPRRNVDEPFELVNSSPDAESFKQYLRSLSKASVAKQLAVGGAAGWCSGFVLCKFGRPAALAISGTLMVLQIASHQGYITINWTKLNRTVKSTQKQLNQADTSELLNAIQSFIKENIFLAGGFASGFLAGIATS